MTFLPCLSLICTLFACTGLHAEPLSFSPCADTAVPGSLCAVKGVYGAYDERGLPAAGDNLELFVRKIPAEGKARGTVWLVAGAPANRALPSMACCLRCGAAFPASTCCFPTTGARITDCP